MKYKCFTMLIIFLSACIPSTNNLNSIPTFDPTPVFLSEEFTIADHLTGREVYEDIFIITHTYPWAANSLVVEMVDGTIVLVDTPWTSDATDILIDWVITSYGNRKIVAINTHHHIDNLGGNQALIQSGISVYGSDLTAVLVNERGERALQEMIDYLKTGICPQCALVFERMKLLSPTEIFPIDSGLTLLFGEEQIEILYSGAGHSVDNVVVYFPNHKILFGGCLVVGWDQIGNTADADMAAWSDSIQYLQTLDTEIIIPGHGERIDPQLLDHTLRLLKEYKQK